TRSDSPDGTTWEQTLNNARLHGTGKLGEGVAWQGTPEVDPTIEPQWVEAAHAARPKRRLLSEAMQAPPPVFLDDDGLFPEGPRIMIVYAEQGNLKTQFLISKCLDIIGCRKGRVVYIAAEDPSGVETQRLPAYVRKRALDVAQLDEHWWPMDNPVDLQRGVQRLIDEISEQEFYPTVVAIDVMTACTGGEDINAPGVGNAIMNAAQRIANAFKCLVVMVTHPGKAEGRGPVGSYAFKARADAVLELRYSGRTHTVQVD